MNRATSSLARACLTAAEPVASTSKLQPLVRASIPVCSPRRDSRRSIATTASNDNDQGSSSSTSRPTPNYPAHIPLPPWEKHFLSLGSTIASFLNPSRGDMIALLTETSGESRLPQLLESTIKTEEGRRLMKDRPRLTTKSVDMGYLETLGGGTFGGEYRRWLDWCRVGPDTRAQVRYIDDPEQAYLMQRYRESHDFYHLLCSMPVSTLGETVVKIFEASHFGLPVAYLSSIAGPLRLSGEERGMLFGSGRNGLANWAWEMGKQSRAKLHGGTLLGVYWEERWTMSLSEMKTEFGLTEPPVRVEYEVKRGMGGTKKKGWTTKTVQRRREREEASTATS